MRLTLTCSRSIGRSLGCSCDAGFVCGRQGWPGWLVMRIIDYDWDQGLAQVVVSSDAAGVASTELTRCFEAIVAACRESASDIMFREQPTHASRRCESSTIVACRCTRTRMIGLCLQLAFRDSMTARTSDQGHPSKTPDLVFQASGTPNTITISSTSKAQGNTACRDAHKQHERSLSHWPAIALAVPKRLDTPARRIE